MLKGTAGLNHSTKLLVERLGASAAIYKLREQWNLATVHAKHYRRRGLHDVAGNFDQEAMELRGEINILRGNQDSY